MNRLAVLLAALGTLGTGCVVNDTCDPRTVSARTVSLGWPSFQFYNGATAGCGGANVGWIDVYMDGTDLAHRVANPAAGTNGYWLCTDGGLDIGQVVNGVDHVFTVEGRDATTTAITFRDQITVGDSCNILVNTRPSEGLFTLDYSFTPNVCTAGSYIWFRVTDSISGDVIAVDESNAPATYTCANPGSTTPLGLSFTLASGTYVIDRTEEVVSDGHGGWAPTANNCQAHTFPIAGGNTSIVDRPMTDSALLCP
jgi:hypothetical protein